MNIYCPACGEYGYDGESEGIDSISPGTEIEYLCPHCATGYKIKIEYILLEEEELEGASRS